MAPRSGFELVSEGRSVAGSVAASDGDRDHLEQDDERPTQRCIPVEATKPVPSCSTVVAPGWAGAWGWGRLTVPWRRKESTNDDQEGNCWPVIVPTTVVVRGPTPMPPFPPPTRGRFARTMTRRAPNVVADGTGDRYEEAVAVISAVDLFVAPRAGGREGAS